MKKQENAQLSSTIRDLRVSLKDAESEGERKRRDLVERCNFMESEARKYKDEYQRICEILKSRINDTINNVSYKKWWSNVKMPFNHSIEYSNVLHDFLIDHMVTPFIDLPYCMPSAAVWASTHTIISSLAIWDWMRAYFIRNLAKYWLFLVKCLLIY